MEPVAKAVSTAEVSQRPFAAEQQGTWRDAAALPLDNFGRLTGGTNVPITKPFAAGSGTPGWKEAASTPL